MSTPTAKDPSPLSHAARRNKETCAEPGPCGRIATMDVVLGGVPVGFCDEDAARRLAL